MTETAPSTPAAPASDGGFNGKWIAAAVLLAVIVIAAIVVGIFVTNGGDEDGDGAGPAPDPTSESDSICGLEPGDQSIPTTNPPETEWGLVGTMAAPSSSNSAGPGLTDGLRTCFAQSPEGALLATANMYAQGTDPELAIPTLEYFVAEGAGREAAIEQTESNPPTGGRGVQIVGFQILEYSEDEAYVDLLARNANGALVSLVNHMVWSEGDWKVIVQPNGQPATPPQQVDSPAGYVVWSGTS